MLNVEGSRLARQQRQPASSPTDRSCREDILLCHEQGGIDQISRVRLLGIACTEIWHGPNAGHSSGVAGVDAGRATPPDPRLARWGLARCCQLDPSHPALVTREDPSVEPCLIPCGPSFSLSRLPAWPVLRCPRLVRPGIGSTLHAQHATKGYVLPLFGRFYPHFASIGFDTCRGQPLSGTQGKRVATFALVTTVGPQPRPARSTPGEPGRA